MPVLGALSVTLEVPEVAAGIKFYTDAGMTADIEGNTARLSCEGRSGESIVLLGGYPRKRLHHVALCANDLDGISGRVAASEGKMVAAPSGFQDEGLWVEDPHGMLIHLVERASDPALAVGALFEINAPGRIVRTRRSAMLPSAAYRPVKPLRLGHILLFSPNVPRSVKFVTEALGMGLADQSGDVIAFCCATKNSDHHVLAFAKSPGPGLHHVSFQVADPDEVGRGGRALLNKSGRGDWGFGRHTIGSNFFHYVQDPWGSWLEYYSDMDFIDDYSLWSPTDYELQDSLAGWGPNVPDDFVHNYEVDDRSGFMRADVTS